MECFVVDWLVRMKEALAGSSVPDEMRQALEAAQRSRARVDLEPLNGRPDAKLILASTIEQVRRDDLLVAQPTIGGRTYPLTTGEKLRIAFAVDGTRLSGVTTCHGRCKTRSGAGGLFYGYRLSIPEDTLLMTERRLAYRAPVPAEIAPEAELHVLHNGAAVTVHGIVEDVSIGGMKLRSRNASGKVAPGMRVFLKVQLPEPVGLITEMIHIAHIREGTQDDEFIIGLRFESEVSEITEAIKALDLERKSRRRSA